MAVRPISIVARSLQRKSKRVEVDAPASRLRRLAPAGLRRPGQGGAPYRLTDLDRVGAVWRPLVRGRARFAIWPASWDVRSSRRLARREAVWGFSKGPWPVGPPEAGSCGYGSAMSVMAGAAVAVVVQVLNVPRPLWFRQVWIGGMPGRYGELDTSGPVGRCPPPPGSGVPVGRPEACSCGYGSDGSSSDVVGMAGRRPGRGWRSCRCSGCSSARVSVNSVCDQAPRRVGAVSEAARRRAPRAAACGRLEDA